MHHRNNKSTGGKIVINYIKAQILLMNEWKNAEQKYKENSII